MRSLLARRVRASHRLAIGLAVASIATLCLAMSGPLLRPVYSALVGGGADELERLGLDPGLEPRLRERFDRAEAPFPPGRLVLIVCKREQFLELWAGDARAERWRAVERFPLLPGPSLPGPKLEPGDGRVPEGLYRIAELDVGRDSTSMRLAYPNAFDRVQATLEERPEPEEDLRLLGAELRAGSLSVGDEVLAELAACVAWTGLERVTVILAPHDLRVDERVAGPHERPWLTELHARLRDALIPFSEGTGSVRGPGR